QQRGALLALSHQVPDNIVQQQVWSLHQGTCPKCGGSGPVDVHVSYRIWSALLMTSWASRLQLSCRPCGRKSQAADAFYSLFLGWWGFPWGLILTPVKISQNLIALAKPPDPSKPSDRLEKIVRLRMAEQAAFAPSAPGTGLR